MTELYRTQIKVAEAIYAKDKAELARHASVGRICKCNDCFCCAAEWTKKNLRLRSKTHHYRSDAGARQAGRQAGYKVRMQQAAGNIGN